MNFFTMFCILAAVGFYTVGLVKIRQYKPAPALTLFGLGLVFDFWATCRMSMATARFGLDWHAYIGWLAIWLMVALVVIGALDILFVTSEGSKRFRAFAPWVTGIWYVSFASGIIKHLL